jgi:Uncharacterized protein conserved in bacteria
MRKNQQHNFGTRRLRTIFFYLFSTIFLISVVALAWELIGRAHEDAVFDNLAAMVNSDINNSSINTSEQIASDNKENISEPNAEIRAEILRRYGELHEKNKDFIGWLATPNTEINYPVMYTPDEPEYYLRRDFEGKYSQSGVPFISATCTVDSDCFIIYGHNMKNDTMFGTLDKYKDPSFWSENALFEFDTFYEERSYKVFAVAECKVLNQEEEGFRYYWSVGDLTKEEFAELTTWLRENALYDTGITPIYGDQILILSTCSNETRNGRFIVAARLVEKL